MTESKAAPQIRRRGIYLLPNLFTIGAMFAGFYAIVGAMKGYYKSAAIAIFVALIMDGLDGRIARLLQAQSEFGAQLDSLSDMLSFGIAPALVLYSWSLAVLGKLGWLVAFFYAVCTALRLARFNVQAKKIDKRYFQGLSTPAAAALVASVILVCSIHDIAGDSLAVPALILAILLGLLKVSAIRYRSFKDFNLSGRVSFVAILLFVLALVFVAYDPAHVLLLVTALYAISGPVGTLWSYRQRRKLRKKRQQKRQK